MNKIHWRLLAHVTVLTAGVGGWPLLTMLILSWWSVMCSNGFVFITGRQSRKASRHIRVNVY